MGNHTPGEFPCPDCPSVQKTLMALCQHLLRKHRYTVRQTWPIIDRLRAPADDLEKFKADFAKLEAGTL